MSGPHEDVEKENERLRKEVRLLRETIRALDRAVASRQPPKGCVHHTDRGSKYCPNEYQRRLSKHGFQVSISGRGSCYDGLKAHHALTFNLDH